MAVNYRDLIIYKKARELVIGVNQLIDGFPNTPQARSISPQLFSAVTSIGANIAEGKAKGIGKEYLRYLTHAQGSANEVDHWLNTVMDCNIAPKDKVQQLLNLNLEVLKMLSSARETLAKQIESGMQYRAVKEESAVYQTELINFQDPLELLNP
jgi:four helix bundle protein